MDTEGMDTEAEVDGPYWTCSTKVSGNGWSGPPVSGGNRGAVLDGALPGAPQLVKRTYSVIHYLEVKRTYSRSLQ
jgi:hypothetical protein